MLFYKPVNIFSCDGGPAQVEFKIHKIRIGFFQQNVEDRSTVVPGEFAIMIVEIKFQTCFGCITPPGVESLCKLPKSIDGERYVVIMPGSNVFKPQSMGLV